MKIDWNELPSELSTYQQSIEATLKQSIEIALIPENKMSLWQSKVGGEPYLPLGIEYPQSIDGENLQLLAQINFSELPENDQYPKSGILQFFINPNDDLYGLNFDDQQKQDGFRIVFYDDVTEVESELQHDFPNLENEDSYSPVEGQYSIQFQKSESVIGVTDFDFANKVVDPYASDDDGDEFVEAYDESFSTNGHRLGGYPFFTQTDPREYNENLQSLVLLLQIDTDDTGDVQIMWGDSGVGNFFIHPDDLKRRDFSKVLYNWDCY